MRSVPHGRETPYLTGTRDKAVGWNETYPTCTRRTGKGRGNTTSDGEREKMKGKRAVRSGGLIGSGNPFAAAAFPSAFVFRVMKWRYSEPMYAINNSFCRGLPKLENPEASKGVALDTHVCV